VVSFYRSSFAKVTAALYGGGALAHFSRSLTGFSLHDVPFLIDWVVMLAGMYGGAGFLVFFRELGPGTRWRRIASGLITVHLFGSVALHAYIIAVRDHQALEVFPVGYSLGALPVFLAFGWVAATTKLQPAVVERRQGAA